MSGSLEIFDGHKVIVFEESLKSKEVAEKFASGLKKSVEPFVLMNLKKVVEKFDEWKRELPGVKPYYAVKCNDNVVLLKVLASLGAGFDCATKGEIKKILKEVKAPVKDILYANSVKTPEFLLHAYEVGVRRTTFDSKEELYKMKAFSPLMEGVLRISCNDETAERHLGNKHGCDPVVDAPILLRKAKELGINVVGVSVHVGSRCCDATIFTKVLQHMRNIFDDGISMGHPMTVVDLGGGFPGTNTGKISLSKIGKCVMPALEKYFPETDKYEFIAEPGRFFSASPFSAAAKIFSAIKVSAQRITEKEEDANKVGYMYFVNDGIYMTFSCKHFDGVHPIGQPLTSDDGTLPLIPACIWGPTCDAGDLIEACTYHRRLYPGEWIFWEDIGAYSISTAVEFNGFPKAKLLYFADRQTMNMIKPKKVVR